jgi:hypothetical protein
MGIPELSKCFINGGLDDHGFPLCNLLFIFIVGLIFGLEKISVELLEVLPSSSFWIIFSSCVFGLVGASEYEPKLRNFFILRFQELVKCDFPKFMRDSSMETLWLEGDAIKFVCS